MWFVTGNHYWSTYKACIIAAAGHSWAASNHTHIIPYLSSCRENTVHYDCACAMFWWFPQGTFIYFVCFALIWRPPRIVTDSTACDFNGVMCLVFTVPQKMRVQWQYASQVDTLCIVFDSFCMCFFDFNFQRLNSYWWHGCKRIWRWQGEVGLLSAQYEKLPVVKLKRYWLRCNYDADWNWLAF